MALSKIRWLDDIGRSSRSTKNEKLENFLTDLQRLTIVHETDKDGHEAYRFTKGAEDDESKDGDEEKEKDNGKGKGKGKGKEKNEDGAAEGDKTMSDQHGQASQHEQDKKEKDQAKPAKPKDKDGREAAQGGKAEQREEEQVHQGGEEE